MCRNIRPLFNFEPPASHEEVHAASLQFVRKVSGSTKPSKANAEAFNNAVDDVAEVVANLLSQLTTAAQPKNRQEETEKSRARNARRFADQPRAVESSR